MSTVYCSAKVMSVHDDNIKIVQRLTVVCRQQSPVHLRATRSTRYKEKRKQYETTTDSQKKTKAADARQLTFEIVFVLVNLSFFLCQILRRRNFEL